MHLRAELALQARGQFQKERAPNGVDRDRNAADVTSIRH